MKSGVSLQYVKHQDSWDIWNEYSCLVYTHSVAISDYSFFNGFLSDSVEITSCEYTKTIIHLRLS